MIEAHLIRRKKDGYFLSRGGSQFRQKPPFYVGESKRHAEAQLKWKQDRDNYEIVGFPAVTHKLYVSDRNKIYKVPIQFCERFESLSDDIYRLNEIGQPDQFERGQFQEEFTQYEICSGDLDGVKIVE